MNPLKHHPLTTLGNLGDYREIPCLGSSGCVWVTYRATPRPGPRCQVGILINRFLGLGFKVG